MNKPSIILIMFSLVISMGCAKSDWIQSTLVTADVTGTWRSTEGGLIELKLEQQGSKVSGSSRGLGPVTTKRNYRWHRSRRCVPLQADEWSLPNPGRDDDQWRRDEWLG